MQNALPPDFSNSEVSTTVGCRPSSRKMASRFGVTRGRDVVPVGYDSIRHKSIRLLPFQCMDPLPAPTDGGERVRGERAGIDEHGVFLQRGKTGIEVVAALVDELQRNHRNVEVAHGGGKFFDRAASRTKPVTGPNLRAIGMPDEVPVAFQAFAGKIEGNHLVAPLGEPVHKIRNLSLARLETHFTGNDELTDFGVMSDEHLVGSEDHVFEIGDRGDRLHKHPSLLQGMTQAIPLLLRAGAVHLAPRHVRILDVPHFEVGGRTEQHATHP